jgi:orotate phosphoribosyltransferase-like protein
MRNIKYKLDWHQQKVFRLGNLNKLVKRAVPKLRKFCDKHKIDAIAFRGMSGACIGSILAWNLNLPMIVCRKEKPQSGDLWAFGTYNAKNYIIIDDLIDSGYTITSIKNDIAELALRESTKTPNLVGIFLYDPFTGSGYKPGGVYNGTPIFGL